MSFPAISLVGLAGSVIAVVCNYPRPQKLTTYPPTDIDSRHRQSTVYIVCVVIYNLYFHPLAKFPGPLLHRATRWIYLYKNIRGTLARDMLAMHDAYGPVVRVAPDELAFTDAEAWKDIYGHRVQELPKHPLFYQTKGIAPSIINESLENHALLRRHLATGFSDRSMRDQEPLIRRYVDLLIARLREHAVDPDRKDEQTGLQAQRPLNMVSWYTWTTFDIIGDLAFAEPFGCLDRVKDDPWIKLIFDSLRSAVVLLAIKFLGLEPLVMPLIRTVLGAGKKRINKSREKLERRLALKAERPDLIAPWLKKKDEWVRCFPPQRGIPGELEGRFDVESADWVQVLTNR